MLWEEMRNKEHQVDTAYVQERVMLRREVRPGSCRAVRAPHVTLLWTRRLLQTFLLTPHPSFQSFSPQGFQQGLLLLQVDKLRLMLVEKENENKRLTDKYLEQVWGAPRGCPGSSCRIRMVWVGRNYKSHLVPTPLTWAGVPSPFWAGPCPSLEQSPDRHLPPPQVRGLEMKLHRTQKVLRTQEEMQEKIKEVRLTVHCSPWL